MKYSSFISSVLLMFLTNCSETKTTYKVKGTIYEIKKDLNKIRIAHDTIPGLMMPMEMDFNILNNKSVNYLSIGDSVHFNLVWDDKPYAENFKIVGKGNLINRDDDFFKDENFSERSIGEKLDDVTLLDIDSSEISISELEYDYTFISFIFTRCPMPTMCPAVVLKNKYLVNSFKEDKRINFILISFDYLYDTPSRLKDYYGKSLKEYKTLNVWSSYQKVSDVYLIGKQAGCEFWGIEKEKIGHTMQSILIDNKRNILGKWRGENWDQKMVKNNIKALMN
jgi:protein SCO1/2